MNRFKLIVLDVDGTLINKAGVIAEIDRRALTDARNNGIRIALCTGRAVQACLHILDDLSLNGYHIFFDGALVYNHAEHQEIFSQHLSPETVQRACELALQDNIPLDLFSAEQYFAIEESWRTSLRRNYFKINPTLTDFKTLWKHERIIKGSILTRNPEEENKARAFIAKFENYLNCIWTVAPAFAGHFFININNTSVSKGKALEALVAHLGLEMDVVAAIGDGANDISLLATAGLSVAMQNSPPELKSQADYVTADVEQGGVAQAVWKYVL